MPVSIVVKCLVGIGLAWGCAGVETALAAGEPPAARSNHWAFVPPKPVVVPSVNNQRERVQTPVDAFVLARLEREGLSLATPADRRSLVRRVAYGLTGLPPTPEAVAAFEADTRPGAFGRMVDRYLDSPEYGERWARWWLDLARYADTNGQDENKVMANAWRYRDWVVRAFNADKPFHEFAMEQLAGDLMPTNGVSERAVMDRWVATGFLVLGPKMLAEQDKPKLVMDLVDEQIDTVTRAFLGLTVACARCHDHKYDPVPTRDYYALAGIFKSTKTMENLDFVSKFNERRVATAEELAAIEAHSRGMKERTERVETAIRGANDATVGRWRQSLAAVLMASMEGRTATNGLDARLLQRSAAALDALRSQGSALELLRGWLKSPATFDQQIASLETETAGWAPGRRGEALLCDGKSFLDVPHAPELEPDRFTLETWVQVREFPKDGDRRRWLVSKNANEWVNGHVALALDGEVPMAYLNVSGGRGGEVALRAGDIRIKAGEWHHLALTFDETALTLYVDGKKAVEQAIGRARVKGEGPIALGRRQDGYSYFKGLIDEARLWKRALTAAEIQAHFQAAGDVAGDGLVRAWTFDATTVAEREAAARARLREIVWGASGILSLGKEPRADWSESDRRTVAALEAERDAFKAQAPSAPAVALAVAEDKPVDLPVHIRGNHLQLAANPVPRGFLQVLPVKNLPAIGADRSGRLELAEWLTDPGNPLTARVVVNRIWQAHFGNGLVRTPENFGVRGESPTHPELLDWLAMELIRSGWSLKHLHRLILESAVWQASSVAEPSVARVRSMKDPDNRLLSVFPRQRLEAEMVRDALLAVSGRLDRAQGGTLVAWQNNEYTPGDEVSAVSLRRSIYLPVVRDRMFDPFTIFDCANPSVGTAKRVPTVVAHQALFFLNSPLVKEAAQALADSVLRRDGATDGERVRAVYGAILQREPRAEELERALGFVGRASGLVKDKSARAAWAGFCQTLLSSNEFLYRD